MLVDLADEQIQSLLLKQTINSYCSLISALDVSLDSVGVNNNNPLNQTHS